MCRGQPVVPTTFVAHAATAIPVSYNMHDNVVSRLHNDSHLCNVCRRVGCAALL